MNALICRRLADVGGRVAVRAVVAIAALASVPVHADLAQRIRIGRDIYHLGRLPDGTTLQAVVQSDAAIDARQLACVSCHRRSGFGATEGTVTVPSVTRDALFTPESFYLQPRQRQRSTTLTGAARPAYDDTRLAAAIRDGVNAAGRPMHPLMPRYALSDEDMAALVAYLGTLSSHPSPGVSETELHLATVISDDIAPDRRAAMVDVLQTFVRDKNAGTRKEYRRQKHAPWTEERMSKAFRRWVLDLWTLQGPRETWPAQLTAYYGKAPVFALMGGMVSGSWRPVHDFCEQQGVPCIFPNTDLPVIDGPNDYNVYLSAGRYLEAQSLARLIGDEAGDGAIVQAIDAADPDAVAVAATFREALPARRRDRLREIDISAEPAALRQTLAAALSAAGAPRRVVWWGNVGALGNVADALASLGDDDRVYLSGTAQTLTEAFAAIPESLRSRFRLTFPYDQPSSGSQGVLRARAWLQGKQMPLDDFALRANSLMVATLFMETTKHMTGFYVRDLLIERLEHEAETAPATGVFPRLSLGPSQRFASRGCYVMKFTTSGELQPDSDWIIPMPR